jgi:hypothetical protein
MFSSPPTNPVHAADGSIDRTRTATARVSRDMGPRRQLQRSCQGVAAYGVVQGGASEREGVLRKLLYPIGSRLTLISESARDVSCRNRLSFSTIKPSL